jgi:glycosyltransferase involved in cell wall biosynthesis
MNKVAYILPYLDARTDTHYYHVYELLNLAAKDLALLVIVERPTKDEQLLKQVKKIVSCRFQNKIISLLWLLLAIIKVRFYGYKSFYVHYSYSAAILSSLVTRIFGGKVFYWNCGMPWLFGKQVGLKVVLRLVNFLITGTPTMAQLYSHEYNLSLEKIKIMPNWITESRFCPLDKTELINKWGLPVNKKIILFVHHLSERKGADKIIPIAKEFVQDSDVIFVVAGDGPLKNALAEQIDQLNLQNQIKLLGRVPNSQVAELMAAADIFIMPSKEEGFPRVLLEAMAVGLPFVASDVGGIKDICSDEQKQFILSNATPTQYAEKIKLFINDETIKNKFIEAGQQQVKNYTIEKSVAIFVKLF